MGSEESVDLAPGQIPLVRERALGSLLSTRADSLRSLRRALLHSQCLEHFSEQQLLLLLQAMEPHQSEVCVIRSQPNCLTPARQQMELTLLGFEPAVLGSLVISNLMRKVLSHPLLAVYKEMFIERRTYRPTTCTDLEFNPVIKHTRSSSIREFTPT